MRMRMWTRSTRWVLGGALSLAVLSTATPAAAAASTGFLQTGAGPYDYTNTANWVGGVINGVWDASLTNTAAQIVTLSTDTTIGSLQIGYGGNFLLTLRADGVANHTVTMGGDLTVAPLGGSTAGLTIGNISANQNLNVDLGGTARTLSVNANHELTFVNTVSDGGMICSGAGNVTLSGSNTFSGGIALQAGQLKMGNVFGFGLGSITISGGTKIDVTAMGSAGATFTNADNNAMTWNGDLSFAAANARDLHLGNGTVTLAAPLTLTASTAGRTLTVGGTVTGGNGIFDITKAGAGGFTYVPDIALTNKQTCTVSAGAETLGGAISGNYSLTKAGAGTLMLSGANSYSGGTVVTVGNIQFNAGAVPANGKILLNGGTLNATGAYANAGAWLASGKIDTSSSSTLALMGTETAAIDLSAYPLLSLAGNAATTILSPITAGATGYQFGGGSTLTLAGTGVLSGNNNLSAGANLIITGSNTLSGVTTVTGGTTLAIRGPNGALAGSDVLVPNGQTLAFDTAAAYPAGTVRARTATLQGGTLTVTGNSGTNTSDVLSGALIVDVPSAPGNGNVVTLTPNASKNAQLSAGSLARTNHGIALVRGQELGAGALSALTANSVNVGFGAAPTAQLLGSGGSAGAANISIIPWLIGSTNATDSGSTFMTYDANGLRPLSLGTEYETTLPASAPDRNVMLPVNANVSVTSDATMNALYLQPGTTLGGGATTGRLVITSGALFAYYGNTSGAKVTITNPVDFGAAEGIVGAIGTTVGAYPGLYLSGSVSGSNGLTTYSPNVLSADSGVWFNSPCAYTGNTYIVGSAALNTDNALPNGTRKGDVYVYGRMELQIAAVKINALNGTGLVRSDHSGGHGLTLGDNDANGVFSGTIAQFGQVSITKIGNGTQTLSGASSTYSDQTVINGGTLEFATIANAGVASSIGVTGGSGGTPLTSGNYLQLGNAALRCIGPGGYTDRLLQLNGSGGAATFTNTIDSSGSGTLAFTNGGGLALSAKGNRVLQLTGSNIGNNSFACALTNGYGAVASTNALLKGGTGKWILTGTHNYSGPTTISGGTLAINGRIVSPATVWSNAVLTGTGIIATNNATALTVNAGGIVDPGSVGGIGTLTVTGNVVFAGGVLRVDAGVANGDLLAVSGSVSSTAGTVLVKANATGPGPWKILSSTTALTPTFTTDAAGYTLLKRANNTELWLRPLIFNAILVR